MITIKAVLCSTARSVTILSFKLMAATAGFAPAAAKGMQTNGLTDYLSQCFLCLIGI
jgi:hypothetical protein